MTTERPVKKPLKAVALERLVRECLGKNTDPVALQKKIEPLAQEPAFPGMTWIWGPVLYKLDQVRFRAFILSHFSTWQYDPPAGFTTISWDRATAPILEPWLDEADQADDVELFKRLYAWKTSRRFRGPDAATVMKELVVRFQAAKTPAERSIVAAKFDLWFFLDQPTALTLYRTDPSVARPYILKRLPLAWTWTLKQKRELWADLHKAALDRNDHELALPLYRRQIPLEIWSKDVLALADRVTDPGKLDQVLEERHPEGFSLDVGATFFLLLKKRGRDILPYLVRHLRDIQAGSWFRSGYDDLLEFARSQGWWDLWATLIRTRSAPREFNKTVDGLLLNKELADTEIRRRLRLLAGVSEELNFPGFGLARVLPLEDEIAVRFHTRFPDLLRGAYRAHLLFTWDQTYPKLTAHLLEVGDDDLIDYLASRALTRGGRYVKPEMTAPAERFSEHYQKYQSKGPFSGTSSDSAANASSSTSFKANLDHARGTETSFARRAASILGQVPAYAIFEYKQLIKTNRLARMLFERTPYFYLEDAVAVQSLLEAPEIHVQALAYRVLALDDDRARAFAGANLQILLGTLLRPLHRATRIAAFGALENAAISETHAERIVKRAREALDLPDKRYPKGDLLHLIARLLHRYPGLRQALETPTVFGGAAA